MTRQELKDVISRAFSDVQLGSGIGLWEGDAIDDYRSEAEQTIARLRDEKLDWSRISADSLYRCEVSLCYFDAEGMRFHLPAFLLAEIDGELNSGPLFHLTSLDEFALSKFALFTVEQRRAVVAFLRWCLENPDYECSCTEINRALDEYWDAESNLRIRTLP